MPLPLNRLSPDQTAVALDIVQNLRRKHVGDYYLVAPFSRYQNVLVEHTRILTKAVEVGINVEAHWIANHKVDKRRHRRVKFTTYERIYLPSTAVFVFPTWKDQLSFKMRFG